MKLDCDVIRDLLPSYADKVLSETSVKLVDEHLNKCKNCQEYYKNMNKDIPTEEIFNQDDQLDFLKGYRKNKKRTIIFSIMITICALIVVFIALFIYNDKVEYSYPINQLDVVLVQDLPKIKDDTLLFRIENIKHNFRLFEHKEIDENNNTIIYLKFIGKCPLIPEMKTSTRTVYDFKIDETVTYIYLENDDGDLKEIWDNNKGNVIQRYEKIYQAVYIKNADFDEIQKLEKTLKDNPIITEVGHVYDNVFDSVIIVANGSNNELSKLETMLERIKIIERVNEIN